MTTSDTVIPTLRYLILEFVYILLGKFFFSEEQSNSFQTYIRRRTGSSVRNGEAMKSETPLSQLLTTRKKVLSALPSRKLDKHCSEEHLKGLSIQRRMDGWMDVGKKEKPDLVARPKN